MEEGGERKRKAVLALDFDHQLRGDKPVPELNQITLSDKDLKDYILESRKVLGANDFSDGGETFRASLRAYEVELARRKLEKANELCMEAPNLGAQGRQHQQPQGGILSRQADQLQFWQNRRLCNDSPTQTTEISSRQAPFESSINLNIDNQHQTNCEQRGSHDLNPSSHLSDRDASCRSSKKESAAHGHSLHPFNPKWNNRKTAGVVDLEVKELDELYETDLVGKSSTETRIYYPSRNDSDSIEICFSHMECLRPETYLSSPIMNFYIRYLKKTMLPSDSTENGFLLFNTYLYPKLKRHALTKIGIEGCDSFRPLRKWWKGLDIFNKAYICLPIHGFEHWSLIIICMPHEENNWKTKIFHLDSKSGFHPSMTIFAVLKRFIVEELLFPIEEGEVTANGWETLSQKIMTAAVEVPQQTNNFDCGLFVLYFLERFINKPQESLECEFGAQWFKPEEASQMREKIHELLSEEFEKAKENACKKDS